MTDIVVTVPRESWAAFVAARGDARRGTLIPFQFAEHPPASAGDTIYFAAHGRLRLKAQVESVFPWRGATGVLASLIAPVTICLAVPGFPGWRKRWWSAVDEQPFDAWRSAGMDDAYLPLAAFAHGKSAAEQGGASA